MSRNFGLTPTEPTEAQLHATVAQFLDWALMPPALYTTFPAGWGVLTRATAGRLKGAGLKQGIPDLLFFHQGRCYCIELKAWRGSLSAVQKEMHAKLAAAGIPVKVCNSLDDVMSAMDEWGIALRRTRGASDKREIQHGSAEI